MKKKTDDAAAKAAALRERLETQRREAVQAIRDAWATMKKFPRAMYRNAKGCAADLRQLEGFVPREVWYNDSSDFVLPAPSTRVHREVRDWVKSMQDEMDADLLPIESAISALHVQAQKRRHRFVDDKRKFIASLDPDDRPYASGELRRLY